MKNYIKKIYKTHKDFWTRTKFYAFLNSVLFFAVAILVKGYSDNYVDSSKSTPVGDLILDNIPTLNVDEIVIQATLIFITISLVLFIFKPKYLAFTLKTLALFVIIRGFFVTLTHLGVNFHQVVMDTDTIGYNIYNFLFSSKSDFFFSGHTGIPFLFALIFYKEKKLRYFLFFCSAFFGIIMFLGHLHYSIDVFAAPFMTYAIYKIAEKLFYKDLKLID
jgi:hypothetical protein